MANKRCDTWRIVREVVQASWAWLCLIHQPACWTRLWINATGNWAGLSELFTPSLFMNSITCQWEQYVFVIPAANVCFFTQSKPWNHNWSFVTKTQLIKCHVPIHSNTWPNQAYPSVTHKPELLFFSAHSTETLLVLVIKMTWPKHSWHWDQLLSSTMLDLGKTYMVWWEHGIIVCFLHNIDTLLFKRNITLYSSKNIALLSCEFQGISSDLAQDYCWIHGSSYIPPQYQVRNPTYRLNIRFKRWRSLWEYLLYIMIFVIR